MTAAEVEDLWLNANESISDPDRRSGRNALLGDIYLNQSLSTKNSTSVDLDNWRSGESTIASPQFSAKTIKYELRTPVPTPRFDRDWERWTRAITFGSDYRSVLQTHKSFEDLLEIFPSLGSQRKLVALSGVVDVDNFSIYDGDREQPTGQSPHFSNALERQFVSLLENSEEGQERSRVISELQSTIDSSRHILELEFNWDDLGSPPVSREAWALAESLLVNGVQHLRQDHLHKFWSPYISPGPDGSVDLVWMAQEKYLLVNCRIEETVPVAGFYGDDSHGQYPIEGSFLAEGDASWLIQWLTS